MSKTITKSNGTEVTIWSREELECCKAGTLHNVADFLGCQHKGQTKSVMIDRIIEAQDALEREYNRVQAAAAAKEQKAADIAGDRTQREQIEALCNRWIACVNKECESKQRDIDSFKKYVADGDISGAIRHYGDKAQLAEAIVKQLATLNGFIGRYLESIANGNEEHSFKGICEILDNEAAKFERSTMERMSRGDFEGGWRKMDYAAEAFAARVIRQLRSEHVMNNGYVGSLYL